MTTLEMDGVFTEEDIENFYTVMLQCKSCRVWTRYDNWVPGENNRTKPCVCGENNYDRRSIKSLRTYEPLLDRKRKPK